MTNRTWLFATVGLWACLIVGTFWIPDGPARIAVLACVTLGFTALAVERWAYYRRHRRARR